MLDAGDIHLREMRPEGGAKGAFLLLHGMESHAGWWLDCAARLTRNGWAVAAFDRPGWGRSPGPRGHMGSYRDFVETVADLAKQLRRKYGRVHLAGMSWGGMAALYLALRRGWLFDSVALIAPGIAALRDLSAGDRARVCLDFLLGNNGTPVSPVFRLKDFTRDPQWREYIDGDPHRVTEVTSAFCIETLKMRRFIREHAGKRRLPPALCLLAGDDDIIDNHETGYLCRKAGALVESLPDAAHCLLFERPAQTAGIIDHHAARRSGPKPGPKRGPVWIVGAGAVGGAAAALLSFGGAEVGALAKTSRLAALREKGLTLRCGAAERTAGGIVFADDPALLPPDPELVILAVKSFDTAAALARLRGALPETACLLSLQNGVGNEERIAAAFPRNTLIAGAVCASLESAGPGVVRWADDRGGLAGAVFQGDARRARAVWERLLPLTGMECLWVDGGAAAARLKWSKLMLNTGFNALNALTGLSSAALLADPEQGALALQALREGFAAMRGLRLHPVDLPGFPVSKLGMLLRAPLGIARRLLAYQARRSPELAFSLRQDVCNNRQYTEIQELNGKIVEEGRRLGIPTPANEKLVALVENLRSASPANAPTR